MTRKVLGKDIYNGIYQRHKTGEKECVISIKSMDKAHFLVKQVWRVFNLPPITSKTSILDVGCGLGYISEALRKKGGQVTAIDISSIAIETAKERFPLVDFRCISFQEIVKDCVKFDIIWVLDFSLISVHDVDFIQDKFLLPCMSLLKKNGVIVLGWHTNFSGRTIENFAHWDFNMLANLKRLGLFGPRIVQFQPVVLSNCIIHICRILKKSIPIYFTLKNV